MNTDASRSETLRRARNAAVAILLIATLSPARAGPGDLTTLEDLVRQWTDVRRQAADETRDWAEQEERLGEDIRWLQLERDTLADEHRALIETDAGETDLIEARRARVAKLRAAGENLGRVLTDIEQRLRVWAALIPPPFSDKWQAGARRMPAPEEEQAGGDFARRARTVTALLSLIEEWQAGVHRAREILSLDNGRKPREFEVLYLGLARGFALSADGTIAAVGDPHPEGWRWAERPDQAGAIADALDAFTKRDARLVSLPIRIREIRP